MLHTFRLYTLATLAMLCLFTLGYPAQADTNPNPQPVAHTTWGAIKALYRAEDQAAEQTPTPSAIEKPGVGLASIGSPRYWVRNECWYALDRNWLYRGDDPNGPGGNGTMSNWNWLSMTADANGNGLRVALNGYQGCLSDLIPCVCCPISSLSKDVKDQYGNPQNTMQYWVNALSADSYGLNWGAYKGRGHAGECPAFVTMVIYRATGGRVTLYWRWGSMGEAACPSAKQAQPGDVVFKTSGLHHVAICVKNDGSKITLVDSNWLGGDGQEVIGRHDLTYDQIGSTWKVYSGAGRWY